MHTLLLGAGYSAWAAGLPVASNLFDFRIRPLGVREEARLCRVTEQWQGWRVGHPDGHPEQFIAEALASDEKVRKDVLWYIVRRLSESFIWTEVHARRPRRHVFMIDENRCPKPGAEFLHSIIGGCSGIITTNYDMLVEYALGTRGFNYGVQGEKLTGRGAYPLAEWRSPIRVTGRLPLAKIHGSVSWDEGAKYTDGRRGLTGNALIVAPTPDKGPPPHLEDTWRLAEGLLAGTERLMVFGFSFHPFDEDVLTLLASGERIRSVLLVDIRPRIERAERVWPDAEILVVAPPPEGLDEIRGWLNA